MSIDPNAGSIGLITSISAAAEELHASLSAFGGALPADVVDALDRQVAHLRMLVDNVAAGVATRADAERARDELVALEPVMRAFASGDPDAVSVYARWHRAAADMVHVAALMPKPVEQHVDRTVVLNGRVPVAGGQGLSAVD